MNRLLDLMRQWLRLAPGARAAALRQSLDARLLRDIGLKPGDALAVALGIRVGVALPRSRRHAGGSRR